MHIYNMISHIREVQQYETGNSFSQQWMISLFKTVSMNVNTKLHAEVHTFYECHSQNYKSYNETNSGHNQ